MPCIKCANGKYKYGEHGNCQYDTLASCKAAAAAIHIDIPSGPHQAVPVPAPDSSASKNSVSEDLSYMMREQYK
jgi:hypothetical protein